MTQTRPPSDRAKPGQSTLPMGADRLPREGELSWELHVVHCTGPLPPFTPSALRVQIGREVEPGTDLVLPDPSVSRVHAVFSTFPGEETAWLQDRESSNGVFVNVRKVEGAAVRPGDVIRLGDSLLVVGRGAPLPAGDDPDLGLLGRARLVRELRSLVTKIGPSALPVLIEGPTGTGKELVARALHLASGRRGRFIALNCAALPGTLVENVLFGHRKGAFTSAVADHEGAFVQANGGTLFLDEVGDLAIEAQPKLLRALENGEVMPIGASTAISVDVRLVAATHVSFDAALAEGRFRRDLFARLAGMLVRTPPLDARREDILVLFRAFLGEQAERPMSADFAQALLLHAWPNNVRELKKLAERLLVLHEDAPRWELGMLDEEMRKPSVIPVSMPALRVAPQRDAAHEGESGPPPKEKLIELLNQCEGNVSKVAELVRRNRKQVYRWMDQWAIDRGTGRRS